MFYLFLGLALGLIVGGAAVYFALKSSLISRNIFEELQQNFVKKETELSNAEGKIDELLEQIKGEREFSAGQREKLNITENQLIKILAEKDLQNEQIAELRKTNENLNQNISNLNKESLKNIAKISELSAENKNLQSSMEEQKNLSQKLQEESKLHFENIANKILEEKIIEIKNRVNETYDKEAKERFSLGEKVKELASLNQQISEDAKRLTRALKGESKTQGNWGEMILESILEKSGLVKGREYFLEHELRNEDNKALFSEFSGKKMRPDAVIKYPDERNVIIDSKVSLTAFTELVDETDPEVYQIKLNQHLASVKNHIQQLSQKAYDDYGKSLDFVMMFIPSEPAYIAAMQADQNIWNYAYERRILLLNPSNLITSLKLIADLWKREYQNRNSIEIAERGAKLYDKFVNFVENLEKVGKNIDQAKASYTEAYKQLHSGRDNLITQTQKMKSLGIKNKKELPQSLIDNSEPTNE